MLAKNQINKNKINIINIKQTNIVKIRMYIL